MFPPEQPGRDRRRPAGNDSDEAAGLVLRGPSDRLAALLKEHGRLLAKVGKRRRDLERLQTKVVEFGARAAMHLEPLEESGRALDEEIHSLFASMLKGQRLGRRERREVQAVYEYLQRQEVITPRPPADPDGDQGRAPHDEADPGAAHGRPASAVRPAPRTGEDGGVLRGLFLRLARALHPDRAHQSTDGHSRTEAMKEVNRAYHSGDLARLMEIERLWTAQNTNATSGDDAEREAADLRRMNAALKRQLADLDRRWRDLRRSEPAEFMRDWGWSGGLEEFAARGQAEMQALVELRDFVSAFRSGQMSLDDFMAGPGRDEGGFGPGDEDIFFSWVTEDLTEMLGGGVERKPAGKRKTPRGRGRRKRSG